MPYKIQNIFPKLSEYHKSLRKGENLERAFKIYEGKIDPLVGIVSGESSLRLVDCLKYYSDCEYFEKIDEIIMVKTDGWDSIIDKMAQTNYSRNEIIIILDIFLKSFFNYSSSSNKQAMSARFTKYLRMMKKVKIEIKNFFIQSYFQLANVNIPSYLGYKWHQILESHYFEYQKIAEIKEDYILKNIQDGKKFFEKWKDGEIAFDYYVNNHLVDESKQEKLVEIKNKLLLTHSIEEAKALQDQVCDIINNIENPCE